MIPFKIKFGKHGIFLTYGFHIYNEFIFIDYLIMERSSSISRFSGFTLVEMLMTILIVSILATIGVTQFTNFSTDARSAVTMEKLLALKTAINGDPHFYSGGEYTKPGFIAHCHLPPETLTDLITLPTDGAYYVAPNQACLSAYDPFLKTGWRGPYVASDTNWNIDAWGMAIQYFVTGPPARTIRSCGPDKICGNDDDLSVTF